MHKYKVGDIYRYRSLVFKISKIEYDARLPEVNKPEPYISYEIISPLSDHNEFYRVGNFQLDSDWDNECILDKAAILKQVLDE